MTARKTKSGTKLMCAEIERLAEEAKAGYVLAKAMRERVSPRPRSTGRDE